jgi:hypothetical protein
MQTPTSSGSWSSGSWDHRQEEACTKTSNYQIISEISSSSR